MCPACIATTAFLIASAISSGGAAAVLVSKLQVKSYARKMLEEPNEKEKTWEPRTSK